MNIFMLKIILKENKTPNKLIGLKCNACLYEFN